MRKIRIFAVLGVVVTVLVACNDASSVSKNQTTVSDDKAENETEQVKELKWYDPLCDENILWEEGVGTSWWTEEPGPGKVGYYDTALGIIQGRIKTAGEKLLPIEVSERTGKTTLQLYTEYIAPLDVKNEFFGLSEGEIIEELTEYESYEKKIREDKQKDNQECVDSSSIVIFITSDKFNELLQKGCPQDMEIIFTWLEKDSYVGLKKVIEDTRKNISYIIYREDFFDRSLIFYEGNMDYEYKYIEGDNGNVSWTDCLQELFDDAKVICDNSKTATDIYEQMKYVVNISIKTEKGLDYVSEEFISRLNIKIDEKSMSYEDGCFCCLAYMTEKEIVALDRCEIFEEPVVVEHITIPEKMNIDSSLIGAYEYVLQDSFENLNDNMLPTYYIDEATGQEVRGYMTEQQIMDRSMEEKETYWDWQLMYEQLWTGEQRYIYENADYFDRNLIWFIDADEIGMPEGGQLVDSPMEGVTFSTYMYKMFEYARVKYDDATTKQNEYENMKYAMEVGVFSGYAAAYVYDNYIKDLGVETQFDGMTDDEAKKWLENKYPSKGGYNLINFKIYVTEEEVLKIKGFGESVTVMPTEREKNLKLTEKYIDIYEFELVPVTYYDESEDIEKREYLSKEDAKELIKRNVAYWDEELMIKQWNEER